MVDAALDEYDRAAGQLAAAIQHEREMRGKKAHPAAVHDVSVSLEAFDRAFAAASGGNNA